MNARRGLSLIEVLVAMAVLAISMLALVPLFGVSVKTNASSNQLGTANTLAREKLEQLIGYPTTDPRLAIPLNSNQATFPNDLPNWYDPATGATATGAMPGSGGPWYPFPYSRTYTVSALRLTNLNINSPSADPGSGWLASTTSDESSYALPGSPAPYYDVKLVTVAVQPTSGPFPGLRQTRQSAFVKFRTP